MTTAILLLLAVDITGHVTGGNTKTDIVLRGRGVDVKGTKPTPKGDFTFKHVGNCYTVVEAIDWHGKALNYAWADVKLDGKPVELKLTPVKPLTGKVIAVGGPLPKGLVVTIPGEISEPVAADGSFKLEVLAPDEYEVEVEHLPKGAWVELKMGSTVVKSNEIDLRHNSGQQHFPIRK